MNMTITYQSPIQIQIRVLRNFRLIIKKRINNIIKKATSIDYINIYNEYE